MPMHRAGMIFLRSRLRFVEKSSVLYESVSRCLRTEFIVCSAQRLFLKLMTETPKYKNDVDVTFINPYLFFNSITVSAK